MRMAGGLATTMAAVKPHLLTDACTHSGLALLCISMQGALMPISIRSLEKNVVAYIRLLILSILINAHVSNQTQHVSVRKEQTSTMASVTGVAPMAARSVDRICADSSSLQSCRIVRITHTSPASGCGSVSAPHAHR